MRAVIDTNVLVHAVVEESPRHGEARRLLQSLTQWLLPSIVLYELVWVFKRLNLSSAEISEILEAVLSNPKTLVVTDDGAHARRALEALQEDELSPSHFNDKLVLATAQALKLPLATYDRELRREAIRLGLPTLPPKL